ncbi:MAG: hypothetical protein ACREU5_07965 [Burkholderiales bacterium]
MTPSKLVRRWVGAVLCCAGLQAAADESKPAPVPDFATLEAVGAVIGEIRITTDDIFDENDPKENNWLFRLANTLHIKTRPGVIRRALVFHSGERVSVDRIEESERLLRQNSFLYDVRIRPIAVHDGVVDIEVKTRDTWSLEPGISFSRSGGSNSGGVTLRDKNLLGTGVTLGYSEVSDPDRSGTEVEFSHHQLFGNQTSIDYLRADYSDGSKHAISLAQPFYALETPWAAGISRSSFDQLDALYSGGEAVAKYRHDNQSAEVFGGLSSGVREGWVQRYSAGVGYAEDHYRLEPGQAAPPELPADQTLAYPFVRYELIEDKYVKTQNRNVIGRPEFFQLGLHVQTQLGRSSTGLGATRSPWLYSGSVGKGLELRDGGQVLGSFSLSGEYEDGLATRQFYYSAVRFYRPQTAESLFYASAALDAIVRPGPQDQLLLGGDNGLRGFPMRYQSGTRRALITLEERFYTDLYVLRLVRVGAAAFLDGGRAWGGQFESTVDAGWLWDVGFGLRLVSDRSSKGNVLHLDVAFPIDPDGNVKSVQFLVKTYASF